MPALWLTHHPPEALDRCARIGPLHVCRRCLALWPLTWVVLAVQVVLRVPGSHEVDLLLPAVLAPPVVDFVGVHLESWPYVARRVWLLSPLLALGLGRLFYRYLLDPLDDATLTGLAAVALPCAWAAWHHWQSARVPLPPELRDDPAPAPGDPETGAPDHQRRVNQSPE